MEVELIGGAATQSRNRLRRAVPLKDQPGYRVALPKAD